jgi:uncharacterized protein (TIGR03067 family)
MSLQGTWEIASIEMEGNSMPMSGARIVVDGDTFRTSGMGAEYSGTLRIDDSVTPWQLDMTFTTGPEKGNTNFCIAQAEGDGFKLCIATRGTIRPTSFTSPKGSGWVVETLRRI